jgi:hypothetical protein
MSAKQSTFSANSPWKKEGKVKVILISGKAQHGKDTIAGFLKKKLESSGEKVLIAHYGDLVKYVCKTFLGWNGEKDQVGRTILQFVGTNFVRSKRPDYWVDFIVSILEMFHEGWNYVIIPDCRFPNEIDRVKEAGFDTIHLRVVRDNFDSPLSPAQQQHSSEIALDNVEPDFYIHNSGSLEDLEKTVAQWADENIAEHWEITFEEM